MTPRGLVVLGIGQSVNWGVLYYAFAALLLPIEAELGTPRSVVTGAFSLALLISALAAPAVGRLADRNHGARLMSAGGVLAAGLLFMWAVVPGIVSLYVVWAGLGLAMAATLYEPAFALVGRAHDEPVARLRALALVTLFGGLASTVFLPLTGGLVRIAGWRVAIVMLAVLLAASTWLTETIVFSRAPLDSNDPRSREEPRPGSTAPVPHLPFLLTVFGFVGFSSAAVIANLVPALGERGILPTAAAALGGTFGVMQLPGRALMMRGRGSASPFVLLAISLGLQATGLVTWALMPSAASVFIGLALFAAGAGLTTLVRPYLVQTMFERHRAGYLNGRLAQAQQLARAAGPVVAAAVASASSYRAVLAVFGAGFALLALGASALHSTARCGPNIDAEPPPTS